MAPKNNAKEKLYSALVELLKTKKLDDISVSSLTATAGVSRNTFYYHFYRPEDVFDALIDNFLDGAYRYLSNVDIYNETQLSNYQAQLELYEYYYNNKDVLLAIFNSSKSRSFMIKFFSFIKKIYKNTVFRYSTPDGSIVDISSSSGLKYDFIINRTAFTLYGFLEFWAAKGFSLTPEEFMTLMYDIATLHLVSYDLSGNEQKQPHLHVDV